MHRASGPWNASRRVASLHVSLLHVALQSAHAFNHRWLHETYRLPLHGGASSLRFIRLQDTRNHLQQFTRRSA